MTSGAVKSVLVLALVAGCLALPLAAHYRNRSRLARLDQSIQHQAAELANCFSENQRLSNAVAGASATAPPDLSELLKLRSEIGRLRAATNTLQRLQAENQRLRDRSTNASRSFASMSEAELREELSAETI